MARPGGRRFAAGMAAGLAVSGAAFVALTLSEPPRPPAASATSVPQKPAAAATASPPSSAPVDPDPATGSTEAAPAVESRAGEAAPQGGGDPPDAVIKAPAAAPQSSAPASSAPAAPATASPRPSAAAEPDPTPGSVDARPDGPSPAGVTGPQGDRSSQEDGGAQAAASQTPAPESPPVAESATVEPAAGTPAARGAAAPEANGAADAVKTESAQEVPAWRAFAATFDGPPGEARVAVVLTGFGESAAAAERALALDAPLTAVVDAARAGGGLLVDRVRAAGGEAVAADSAAEGPFVGVALRAGPPPRGAATAGMLALDLRGGAPADYAGGPVLAPDMSLPEGSSAERTFATLREAEARARRGDRPAIVALPAQDAAVAGLARWLAVTTAQPVPLTVTLR